LAGSDASLRMRRPRRVSSSGPRSRPKERRPSIAPVLPPLTASPELREATSDSQRRAVTVGLVAAVLLSHYMESMLFELKPSDPWAYLVVSALLAVVAAAACYIPARRAARIDPITALRTD